MDIKLIERLNEIGIALSRERDIDRLLERILRGAKDITNAEAGTLYSLTEENTLRFDIVLNDSLNLAVRGSTHHQAALAPIPLYDITGRPNTSLVVVYAVQHHATVNIPDAYQPSEDFDFSGTRRIDQIFGYRSKSFLTVPLMDSENRVIGVFQLINARGAKGTGIVAFSPEQQRLVESLASQAAVALTRYRLAQDTLLSHEPVSIRGEANEETSLFSASKHAARLELCDISAKDAQEISMQVYRQMLNNKTSEISDQELARLSYETIKKALGAKVARRILVWNRFWQSGRPLFLLIGGASGTGKSTVSAELSLRLGIERIYSTDTLREVMRLMVSQAMTPALYHSSYNAWKGLFDLQTASNIDKEILVVEGYKAQARSLAVAIDGVIKRAIQERVSCIVEGIHLYPSYKERVSEGSDAVVVPLVLAVPDRRRFNSYFKARGSKAPARDQQRYLKYADAIWYLQAYLISEADRCDVPVIPNVCREQTIRQIFGAVTEVLEQEF
jgi:2-phosphoglycerate kinase